MRNESVSYALVLLLAYFPYTTELSCIFCWHQVAFIQIQYSIPRYLFSYAYADFTFVTDLSSIFYNICLLSYSFNFFLLHLSESLTHSCFCIFWLFLSYYVTTLIICGYLFKLLVMQNSFEFGTIIICANVTTLSVHFCFCLFVFLSVPVFECIVSFFLNFNVT